jgi:transglutaminase-like putative cysteine protease
MVKIRPRYQAAGAVLAIIVLGAALASAFDQMDIGTVTDYGDRDLEILNRTGRWSGNGPLLIDSVLMGQGNIFEVRGVLNTSYLRTNAYSTYADGVWTADQDYGPYDGELLTTIPREYAITPVIIPAGEIHGQLVTAQRTAGVLIGEQATLEYSAELDAFRTSDYLSIPYSFIYNGASPLAVELRTQEIIAEERYLQVPEDLRAEIEDLARAIVQGSEDPFDRATVLMTFLKERYSYLRFYSETPAGMDEVEHFLFSSQTGQCTHFNSAFVLMARSIGLPARICSGYLVDATAPSQNVTSLDAHAYSEVRFGEDTWVIFDATPENSTSGTWEDPKEGRSPSLYGFLFNDRDEDQMRGTGEQALRGWTVILMNSQGVPLAITTTSLSGLYGFDVTDGDYIVKVIVPEGYAPTLETAREVHVDVEMMSVDFGFVIGGPPSGTASTVTQITSDNGVIVKGRPFTVQGTVSSGSGIADGGRVLVYLAPTKTSPDRALCGEGVVASGTFAAPCMALNDLDLMEYQLIARFVGDTSHAPSESDPPVSLWDETVITVGGTKDLIAELDGQLTFTVREKGTSEVVPFADLVVDMDGDVELNTGAEGVGILPVAPGAARTAMLNVSYGGGPNLVGSTYFSPVQVPGLQVDMLSAKLVRNESGAIIGRAHAGTTVPSQALGATVELDDPQWASQIVLGSASLDRNGLLIANVQVSPQVPLGAYNFSISIGPLSDFRTVALNVTARPVLQATSTGDSVSVLLLDDRGEPISGRPVTLETPYSTRTVVTDAAGRASATMRSDADCNCTVTFEAQSTFQGASVTVPIVGSGLSLLWLAIVPAIVIPLVYFLSRRMPRSSLRPVDTPLPPSGPYFIVSPQLGPGMPLVWDEGSPLDVSADGGEGPLHLTVDNRRYEIVPGQMVRLELKRGEHRLIVVGPDGNNHHLLRIVDYRTEIAKLYIDQVKLWCAVYEQVKLPMAPREVQALMNGAGRSQVDLEAMVSLFEAAQYSEHPIGRNEYEAMVRAVRGTAS